MYVMLYCCVPHDVQLPVVHTGLTLCIEIRSNVNVLRVHECLSSTTLLITIERVCQGKKH